MKTDIKELFQRKYDAEIIKITPQKREEIIRQAESFVCEKFAREQALDGGQLFDVDSAIVQSLLELFVRNNASENMKGPMLQIDFSTYKSALENFKEFINQRFSSYDLLQAFWLQQAQMCICETFSNSKKIFKTYLMGELCENLYINNKTAELVIEELKNQKFLKVSGYQHNQELLAKISGT